MKMIDRLVNYGLLVSTLAQGKMTWQLGKRKAAVIELNQSASIGVVINVPIETESDWLRHMSLVLAACEEARDCGLQYQNNEWILWRYYDEGQDEDALYQALLFQQALANFLEKDRGQILEQHSASIVGRVV